MIKTVARDGTRRGCYPRSEQHKARLAEANRGKQTSSETRSRISAACRRVASTPEWRESVRRGTVQNFVNNPKARARHRRGLRNALETRGIPNFFTGGQGQPANELAQFYAGLLCPLGYVAEHRVRRYRIDFALVGQKIAIEIDGTAHRSAERRAHDNMRDAILRLLGWRVIRVRHYAW